MSQGPSLVGAPLVVVALAATTLAAQETSGTLVGVVVEETGAALPYSVVSVPSLSIHRFSSDNGTFILRDVSAGSRVVRIRRLGYAPKEVPVTVHAGGRDSIRVELTRVALKLAAVQVRADPPCTTPGLSAVKDSALRTVLTQLRMNGDQYRLLTEEYPFVYTHERMFSSTLEGGDMRIDDTDTLIVESKPPWRYRPGHMLTRVGARGRGIALFFNIPTLSDFAEQLFLDNHCFMGGGIDQVDGRELIRIDLAAWSRIKNPDVNGSIFLDPVTFQIRRSVLRLSRRPNVRGLKDFEVTTVFQEALPSVPVVAQVFAVQTHDARRRNRDPVVTYEHHRLIAFTFVGARPGQDP